MVETLKRTLVTVIFLPILYIGLVNNSYHALYFVLGVAIIGFLAYFELRRLLFRIGFLHTFLVPLGIATIYIGFFYEDFVTVLSILTLLFMAEAGYWMTRKEDFAKVFQNILSGIFVVLYLGIMWGCLILLRKWNNGEVFPTYGYVQGTLHCLILIVGIWMCDIGAYFGGRWFGKTKLNLAISPNKTLEGFISGVVVSLVCIWLVATLVGVSFHIAMVLVPFAGILGDLFESLIKRTAGVKDSSHLVMGHGGILDVFDALIFGSPLYYFAILPWFGV